MCSESYQNAWAHIMPCISCFKKIAIIVIIITILASTILTKAKRAHALDDPNLVYKTLTTTHFHVHYHQGWEDLAKRVAQISEEAHHIMTPIFDWTPAIRTHVFLTDTSDTANGSATPFGRNFMTIYGMPPESDSVLGYYDDWLRILVYHEYAHILHLDTTLGISSMVNTIIGKQLHPNQLLPRWFIEGVAVYHETARTGTGRINSSLFRMWLRAEALSGKFFTLGQITGSPARWPFGSASYLYGAFFVDYIARKHGESFLTDFNHAYGATLIPYKMNAVARDLVKETFDKMWTQFTAETQGTSLAHLIALRARGETHLEPVTQGGTDHKFVRSRPKHNEISYSSWSYRQHPTMSTLKTRTNIHTPLFEVDGATGASAWTPDGTSLLFTRTTNHNNVYRYSDLFRYDTHTKHITRLTHHERARDMAISPDGKKVVYTRVRKGTMELVLRGLEQGLTGKEHILISGLRYAWNKNRHWQHIATPVWTPDGQGIVFGWWRQDLRTRDLWLWKQDAMGKPHLHALMRDEAMDLDPHFGPDGLLYFSSDRTGTYNIYAMDMKKQKTWQISDVSGGVFSPAVSQDGQWVYVSSYSTDGYDIARFARPTRHTRHGHSAPEAKQNTPWRLYPRIDQTTWTHSDYNPIAWLAPLLFLPNFALTSTGALIAGSLSGFDPASRHRYNLNLNLITGTQNDGIRPGVGLSYMYNGFPFDFTLSAGFQRYPQTRGLFAMSQDVPFLEQQAQGHVSLRYPISTIDDSLSLGVNYVAEHRSYYNKPVLDPEPADIEPIEPELGWFNELSLSLTYSNLERYPYSVSVERGLSTSLSIGVMDDVLGSDHEALTVRYGLGLYHPAPWANGHVFAWNLNGGFIDTSFRQRSTYSIGGIGPQNIVSSILFQQPLGGLRIRGYPPGVQSGNQYIVSNAEYRFPILDLERGFSTTPLFFRRLKGRLFFDSGSAYNGFLNDANLLLSLGGEIQLTAIFGYYLSGSIRLGYAHGFDATLGEDDLYVIFAQGF